MAKGVGAVQLDSGKRGQGGSGCVEDGGFFFKRVTLSKSAPLTSSFGCASPEPTVSRPENDYC